MKPSRRLAWALYLSGCATLADGGPGLDATPSANVGPFRLFRSGEVGLGRAAPNVLAEPALEASELSARSAGEPSNELALVGYVSALFPTDDPEVSVRGLGVVTATDGRTFSREVTEIARPTEAWQGEELRSPSVATAGNGDVWVAYAAELGVAVVRETDGELERAEAPALRREDLLEGVSPPRAPGLVFLPDGTSRLFYETELADGRTAIGVALGEGGLDGELTFVDLGIVIQHAEAGSIASAPCAVVAEPTAGADDEPDPSRARLHVYFASQLPDDRAQIRLASRFLDGEGEALTPSEAVMYRPQGDLDAREPAVVRFDAFSVLFVTQRTTGGNPSPLVVAGVAPADVALPTADPP